MLRLGLFQMGLGIMSLLTLGVLNRVMIDELTVLPFIAAGAIAMHQFVSPARIWFGQKSDSQKIFGYHRSGYVWIGAALFTSISFVALQVVWQLGTSLQNTDWSLQTYGWSALLALIFGMYGLALSASSTPFTALLVDITDEDDRPKLIAVVWSMLMMGIVIGASISSRLLERPEICGTALLAYDPSQMNKLVDISKLQTTINPVFIILPGAVFVLTLLATLGIEKKYSRYGIRGNMVEREDQITLGKALKILTANRQTGIIFWVFNGIDPKYFYAGLNSGTLWWRSFWNVYFRNHQIKYSLWYRDSSGYWLHWIFTYTSIRQKQTTKTGCIGATMSFCLIIMAGFSQNSGLLMGSLFFFGLASGVITTGATNLMLDLTAAETAGTFVGAWGLSQAMARGMATVLGGTVLNLGKLVFTSPMLAYGMVFALQAIGMLLAIWLLRRVNVVEFQQNSKQVLASVLESELD
ncbi:PUCC protein [Cylindrospermopsis raciborskii CS-505]|nr:PUCC protein [Cylindrospermopsis raciborskii CS-505]